MIDPASLQVMGSALRGVAEEMGAALVRAAHSANIKERRDCSTAVFDRRGRMIAQAEHMPVHLGAMPDAVAACLELKPKRGRRDAWSTTRTRAARTCPTSRSYHSRATSACWSHAPTTPTSAGCRRRACRSGARELYQEGLVIPPVRLTPDVERLMMANMRNPRERLADLRAQIACHRTGAERLAELSRRFGRARLLRGMDELHAASERRIAAAVGPAAGRHLPRGGRDGGGRHLDPGRADRGGRDRTREAPDR